MGKSFALSGQTSIFGQRLIALEFTGEANGIWTKENLGGHGL